MKYFSKISAVLALFAIAFYAGGCAGTGTMTSNPGLEKERLLAQAGFRVKNISQPKMLEAMAKLPANKVSAVKFKGRTYYVYPKGETKQAYVGNKAQYQAYRGLLQAKADEARAASRPQPVFTDEIVGPGLPIPVRVYEDWSPLLDAE